jgi:hypothetical protein
VLGKALSAKVVQTIAMQKKLERIGQWDLLFRQDPENDRAHAYIFSGEGRQVAFKKAGRLEGTIRKW